MSQDSLDRSDSFRKHMLDTLSDAIFAVSADGQILEWNRGAQQMTGYSERDITAMQPQDLFVVSERDRITSVFEEIIRRGQTTFEADVLTKDGRIIPLELKASLMTYDRPIICLVGRDISSRKRAFQALRESEEKFRALAENSTVGIFLIQDGYLRYVNAAFAKMYGYSPEELIDNVRHQDLAHPGDRPRVSAYLERRLQDLNESFTYRFRGITKNGKTIHVEGYGRRTEYQGRPAIIGTETDITDRLHLQRELFRGQEDERRQIGRDLHDSVGTQLSAVSLLLRVLERDLTDHNPDLAHKLRQVRTYVQEADRNTKKISTSLNPVPLEKDGLAAALNRLVATDVDHGDVSCELTGAQNIPELPGEVAAHLYWVAQATVTHAVKYRDVKRISIELTASATELILTVEDDGRGSVELEESLNGLSLQKMKYRTELLGGMLTITSDPDGRITVSCQLPVDREVSDR